jgi:cellular nucleic acid-binding protein
MESVYVLQLKDDKYYIGKAKDVQERFKQHKMGKGSSWTKEYTPIKIVETRPMMSNHDENNITKDYMKKYGIDNVRGGSYCQVELPEEVEDVLRMELKGNNDKCYNCGKKGHFANRCPNNESEYEEEVYVPKKSGTCYRCGRKGHYSPDCYAQTHVRGYELDD